MTSDQDKYVSEVADTSLESTDDHGRLFDEKERTVYRGLMGELSWCTAQRKPDFWYAVCRLSHRSNCPTVIKALQANNTIAPVKERPR